jgi:quinol monooxygenase YgiN
MMATGMLIEFNEMDEKRYERVNELLALYQNPPKGLLFHSAGPIANGWRVFDIWESKEAFDQFLKERLQTALQQAGITGRPARQEFFPIHNVYAPQPNVLTKIGAAAAHR